VLALVAGVVLLGTTATAGAASSPSPSPSAKPAPPSFSDSATLRLGWLGDPDNLNPFIGTTSSAYTIWYMNYDTLVGLNAADLTPDRTTGLATAWSSSQGGKVWTFALRHDVTWQDGRPLTASDVAFTINDIVDNQNATWISYVQNVTRAVVVDAYHVRLICKEPTPSMLDNLAELPILPQHIWAKIPTKIAFNTLPNKPPIIGSGPFECVKWTKSNYLVMKANKQYWRGPAHVDQVVFEYFTNPDTMAEEMRAGLLDGCSGLLQAQMTMLAGIPGVETRAVYVNGYDELGFNCYTGGPSLGNPVLKDWRFRQALQWAVDKAKLAAIAYGGKAEPADTVITAGYYKHPDWHWNPPPSVAYKFDLAKAGQMLSAAGYPLKNGVRVDRRGRPIKLRLYARSEYPQGITCGKFLTTWFRELGLNIQLSTVDDGALEDAMYNTVKGTFTPDYDMFLWGWYNDIDPGTELAYFTTAQINSWSDCAWSSPPFDRLYTQQSTEMDTAKRLQMIYGLQEMIYQQSPYIPLAYSDDTEAWNTSRWTGWVESPARVGNVIAPPYGYETFYEVRPIAGAGGAPVGQTGVLVVLGTAVVLCVAGAGWLLIRRKRLRDAPGGEE
jgi:peptide/nickel transport system substrate-binding protein